MSQTVLDIALFGNNRQHDVRGSLGIVVDRLLGTYDAHLKKEDPAAEQNIPYTISRDGGRTWSEIRTTHFAKGIRNMQLSGKLGQWYFMQGRSGSQRRELVGDDPGPGNFVLYSSRDGIQWDEGIVLMSSLQTPGGGDCYSDNEIIGKYNPATPQRLLIHSDVSYSGAKTNMHQWWVTTAPWKPGPRVGPTEGKDANASYPQAR